MEPYYTHFLRRTKMRRHYRRAVPLPLQEITDHMDALGDALGHEEWWPLLDSIYNGPFTCPTIQIEYQGRRLNFYAMYTRSGYKVGAEWTGPVRRTQENNRIKKNKRVQSKVLWRIVEHIRSRIEIFVDETDAKILQQKVDERRSRAAARRRRKLVKSFGVALTYGTAREDNNLIFQMGSYHHVQFDYVELNDGGVVFHDISIQGDYTQEQVKELIDWLARCPQAVANRVLGE
jgi:hypothetical protein